MKIDYVTNVRIPTTRAEGYATIKMCEGFSSLGIDINLYVPNRRDVDSLGDPFIYYNVKNKFEIFKLKHPDLLSRTLKFSKITYFIDIVFFVISLRLYSLWDDKGIFYTRDFITALMLPKKKPIYLEIHNIPRYTSLFLRAIDRSKLLFVLNNSLKKDLQDLGVSGDKIFVSGSSVDMNEFNIDISQSDARYKLDLPIDKDIIMYTGHLYPWKGVDTLADVAKKMTDRIFVFVGGVDPNLSEFKNKYKNYKNIIIRPFSSRKLIALYLKSADVLVLPNSKEETISYKYTSPLKLFEYMASKKPIIASKIPSIMEILDDKSCFFAEPDNTESFSEAIEKAFSDKDLSEAFSRTAFNIVKNNTWDVRAKNILEEIKKTL